MHWNNFKSFRKTIPRGKHSVSVKALLIVTNQIRSTILECNGKTIINLMLSAHICDFLEDRIESHYDNELSLKSVRQKNSARPQQDVNQI